MKKKLILSFLAGCLIVLLLWYGSTGEPFKRERASYLQTMEEGQRLLKEAQKSIKLVKESVNKELPKLTQVVYFILGILSFTAIAATALLFRIYFNNATQAPSQENAPMFFLCVTFFLFVIFYPVSKVFLFPFMDFLNEPAEKTELSSHRS